MSDYVLSTSIDSSAALNGANEFNRAVDGMIAKVNKFKEEIATVTSSFASGTVKMSAEIDKLSSSINSISIAGFERIINASVLAREQITLVADAGRAANLVSLGQLIEQLRTGSAAAANLARELLNIHEPNNPKNRNGGNTQQDTQPQLNGIELAATLAASMSGFKSSMVQIKDLIAEFGSSISTFGNVFKMFGVSIGGAASQFAAMADGIRSLEQPLGIVAPGMTRISVALAAMGSSASSIMAVTDALYKTGGAANSVMELAASIELLVGSFKHFNATTFQKEFDKLKASLGQTELIDKAASSLSKIAEAAAMLRDESFVGIEKMAANLLAATNMVREFDQALNNLKARALLEIADAFQLIEAAVRAMLRDVQELPGALLQVDAAMQRMESLVGRIDLSKFAASIRAALPSFQELETVTVRLANQFETISVAVREINQLSAGFNNQLRQAQTLAAQLGETMAQNARRAAGGNGGDTNSLMTGVRNMAMGIGTAAIDVGVLTAAVGVLGARGVMAFVGITGQVEMMRTSLSGIGSHIIGNTVPAFGRAALGAAQFVGTLSSAVLGRIAEGFSNMATQVGHFTSSMLAFSALNQLTTLPSKVLAAADAFTTLDRRIVASAHSAQEQSEIMAAVTEMAQRFRQPIEEVGRSFSKMYEVMHGAGNTIEDTKNMMSGLFFTLLRGGATAQDAKQEAQQYFQMLMSGTMSIRQLNSLAAHDPSLANTLIAEFGSLGKFKELVQQGGDVANKTLARLAGALSEIGRTTKEVADTIPRTFTESMIQLENQWTLTIGKISQQTGFMDKINIAVDRLKAMISSDAFTKFFGDLVIGAVNIGTSIAMWATQGEGAERMLMRLIAHLKNIGTYAKAGLQDLLPFSSGNNLAAAVAGTNKSVDKEINDAKSSPFTGALTGDKAAVEIARERDGLNKLREDMAHDVLIKVKFATEEARVKAFGDLRDMESQAEAASLNVQKLVDKNIAGITQGQASAIAQQKEWFAAAAENIRKGEAPADLNAQIADHIAKLKEVVGQVATAGKELQDEVTAQEQAANKNAEDVTDGIVQMGKVVEDISPKAKAAAAELSIVDQLFRALDGKTVTMTINQVVQGAVDPTKTLKIPQGSKSAKKSGGGENSYNQKIKTLKDEVELKRASLTMDEDAITAAKNKLELDKALKESMVAGNEVRKAAITALIQEKQSMEEQLKWAKEFQSLGQGIGTTLSDAFISGAKSGEKFGDTMKKAFASILEQIVKMLVIKPLIDNFANSLGAMGGQIGAASGGKASQGLFGLLGIDMRNIGGGAAGAAEATTWTTAVTTSATGFTAAVTAADTSLTTAMATSVAEFGTGVTTGVTTAMTELTSLMTSAATEFSTVITTAASEAAASLQTASLGGGGGAIGGLGGLASLFAADGHAFTSATGGPVSMFANGGIFDSATPFSYGGGKMGVMGEAGPEAVMPLSRGADGKLGIRGGNQQNGATVQHVTNITITGDANDETVAKMHAIAEHIVTQRTPGIVDRSTSNVVRKNRDNANFLQR